MTDTMAHTQPASPASPASPAPTITAPGGRFVFGGDWHPEQWDESTWADDIAKLERAGIIRPVEPAITVYGPYGRPTRLMEVTEPYHNPMLRALRMR